MLFAIFPMLISATGRWDFYYTLTSVALLSIASAGVWLTFYIGRINIGQGAYALVGGYVSAVLVTKYGLVFWWTLPLAGLFCAVLSVFIGLPILRLKGVYFAMITLVLTKSRDSAHWHCRSPMAPRASSRSRYRGNCRSLD